MTTGINLFFLFFPIVFERPVPRASGQNEPTPDAASWTDLDPGGVAHGLRGDVGLAGLCGDQRHPKDLLEGVSDRLHVHLLVGGHHDVDVPAGLCRATTTTTVTGRISSRGEAARRNSLMYGAMPGSSVVIMDSTECFVLSRTVFTTWLLATP